MHIAGSGEHFGFSCKPLGLSSAAKGAMSSQTTSGWSCATLRDGVDKMDLDLEEQQLRKMMQASPLINTVCKFIQSVLDM